MLGTPHRQPPPESHTRSWLIRKREWRPLLRKRWPRARSREVHAVDALRILEARCGVGHGRQVKHSIRASTIRVLLQSHDLKTVTGKKVVR